MKRLIVLCLMAMFACVSSVMAQTFTILDAPGATYTMASGIYGNNIVDEYISGSGDWQSSLYNGSARTTLDYPGSNSTNIIGIDGNKIVGHHTNEYSDSTDGSIYSDTVPILTPESPSILLITAGLPPVFLLLCKRRQRSKMSIPVG